MRLLRESAFAFSSLVSPRIYELFKNLYRDFVRSGAARFIDLSTRPNVRRREFRATSLHVA